MKIGNEVFVSVADWAGLIFSLVICAWFLVAGGAWFVAFIRRARSLIRDIRERKKDAATYPNLIDSVRRQLSDEGVRIAEAPTPFAFTWWPAKPSFDEQLEQLSPDFEATSGPKQLIVEFDAEVKAIHECLDKLGLGHAPHTRPWKEKKTEDQGTLSLEEAYRQIEWAMSHNQHAAAVSVWQNIAFPLRRRGNIVYRIFPPLDAFQRPFIGAIPVDHFIRGVTSQTVHYHLELARLQKHLTLWRVVAGVSFALLVLLAYALLR